MNARPAPHGFTVDQKTRKRLVATIERLIAILDALDGDADLEPNLGSVEAHGPGSPLPFGPRGDILHHTAHGSQHLWGMQGRASDGEAEEDHDREYDEAEHDAPGIMWGGGEDSAEKKWG